MSTIDYNELARIYAETVYGYDEPDYVEMTAGTLRKLVEERKLVGLATFIAAIDASCIPDEAIIVNSHGKLSVLVDEDGHLLTFSP